MGDQKDLLNQEEIERLLQQSPARASAEEAPKPTAPPDAAAQPISADQIEAMLSKSLAGPQTGGNRPASSPTSPTGPQPAPPTDDSSKLHAQEEIDRQLRQSGKGPPVLTSQQPAKEKETGSANLLAGEGEVAPDDLEFLLNQAEQALASIDGGQRPEPPPGVVAFRLEEFAGAPPSTESTTLDLIRDVELDLRIELGRTHMYLEDVLKLRRGSVVPLDKLAGDPVDIFVNGRLIARGEVLVLNDNFCVRVAELIAGTTPAG
jgi:flagellar motor switch protein FliN/FliY